MTMNTRHTLLNGVLAPSSSGMTRTMHSLFSAMQTVLSAAPMPVYIPKTAGVCVCVCERERERQSVCVCARARAHAEARWRHADAL